MRTPGEPSRRWYYCALFLCVAGAAWWILLVIKALFFS